MSRLPRLLALTLREADHLLGLRQRLLQGAQPEEISEHWLGLQFAD